MNNHELEYCGAQRKALKVYKQGLEQVGAGLWKSLQEGKLQRGLRHFLRQQFCSIGTACS